MKITEERKNRYIAKVYEEVMNRGLSCVAMKIKNHVIMWMTALNDTV